MAFKYTTIVPWGRSFEEYTAMFHLTQADLNKAILGCGDGPACFNSIMNQKGKRVISIDPIYSLSAKDIEQRINETYADVISQTRKNTQKFNWTIIKDVDELGRIRMDSMKKFLADFENGKKENRYISAELPHLPFKDKEFELALSSHFLFLYTDNLTLDFHIEAIDEMLRVSEEVRIFPLLDMNARVSSYVGEIIKRYNNSFSSNKAFSCTIERVAYEFQKNGNEMLRISRFTS
ncbi:MAG: hypothetical protein JXJ04_24505 [Spirochaetales bacterium]|nr:hypothetical protein [Spirochaetales bacterium]